MTTPEILHPELITCTVCGHRFDPAKHSSCSTCPLHQGCSTACCPNCGASNINPTSSRLAGWLKSLLGVKNVKSTVLANLDE